MNQYDTTTNWGVLCTVAEQFNSFLGTTQNSVTELVLGHPSLAPVEQNAELPSWLSIYIVTGLYFYERLWCQYKVNFRFIGGKVSFRWLLL